MESSTLEKNYKKSFQARKEAELHCATLSNRIKFLQQEELKSRKKIEEAKKRIEEVSFIKDKLQDKYKRKANSLVKNKICLIEKREKINQMKSERQKGQLYIKASLYRGKRDEAFILRELKKYYKEQREDFLSKILNENIAKKNKVLMDEAVGTQKLNEFYKFKIKDAKSNLIHKQRTASDEGVKKKQLKDLEEHEMKLIEKLQSTQIMQKQAYEELNYTLTHNPARKLLFNH